MVHCKATKKVVRYLEGTKDYMLTYRDFDQLELVKYSYSNFSRFMNS